MSPSVRSPFPPATRLLSRAWWELCDHPAAVLALGLGGSAPFAGMLLLYLREAEEGFLVPGTAALALKPLAFGLAGIYLLRFPFRLALARWMAQGRTSAAGAAAWALRHLPTALLYGAVSTLGWLGGLLLIVPFQGAFLGSLAFHRFAASEQGAWEALRESARVPVWGIGWRLLTAGTALFLCAFLILWTGPDAALGLAEWLLRADVAALRELFSPASPPWLFIALILPLAGIELLWSLAFGLLAAEWRNLSEGADLAAALRELDARAEAAA